MMGYYLESEATLARQPVMRRRVMRRPAWISGCCPPGLGLVQQGAGTALSIAPFTGPAAPFVAAGAALTSIFSSLFHGADPREAVDNAKIEAGGIAINQLINEITGENLPTNCTPGQCGKQGVAIWTSSKYPNVPNGPLGNPNINIDDAISQVQSLVAQIKSQMVLQQSLSNPFFTGPYGVGLLQKIKAAREAANPLTSAASALLPSSVTSNPLLALGLVGGGLWAVSHFL